MLQSTDMSGINYKARIVMSHNCTHDRLVLACVQSPPGAGGGGVCTQANLIQVYFIHAYLVNCNKIPQISNPERKMEKKVRNNISKRPGEMCSGERSKAFEFTGVISEIENKVATITTLCIRDETNKWIQFRNIGSIYFQYWCQHFS